MQCVTHLRSLGMILSFSLMTLFMMPPMVLEPESWLPRYLEYLNTCMFLGDMPDGGVCSETGPMLAIIQKKIVPVLVKERVRGFGYI